eukprot:CAMPEP_0117746830 /NCGR_PEP_ID=MMETSP0947-20121206/8166_1 /TAXON_ID=44440 /ORGANISM="Chattonella subsalsa, Strain CCMP2191" /LENGTH=386 /DNA_ID=CAMNT_0005564201 /DNA_START=45 /DNA_END=1205 /DNA_ORIENTATION=-
MKNNKNANGSLVKTLLEYFIHPDRAWLFIFLPALSAYLFLLQQRINYKPVIGSIERLDPELDKLIPVNTKIEVIGSGFNWTEGPLWVEDTEAGTSYLLFSEVKSNRIWKWERGGLFTIGTSLFLDKSGCTSDVNRCDGLIEPGSNGLVHHPSSGLLVVCQHGERMVARLESNGTKIPLATHYNGKKLNSPNDAIFSPEGDLFFTDPPYGLNEKEDDEERELDFNGVYRVSSRTIKAISEGQIEAPDPELISSEMTRPNGLAFSPDFLTLYVANSDSNDPHIRAFQLNIDGEFEEGSRIFFDASGLKEKYIGNPDGLKVDEYGNLFATGPGGVLIISPEGKHLGTILTGVKTGNVAFGEGYIYIAADSMVLRVRITTKQALLPEIKS